MASDLFPGYRIVHDDDPHAIINRVINLTNATDVSTPVLLSKMHYRDVLIQELNCNAVALEDSGAEISIVPSSLVRDLNLVCLEKNQFEWHSG